MPKLLCVGSQGTPLPEDEARRMFQAMSCALAYCSHLNVAHTHVKLDNWILHQVPPPPRRSALPYHLAARRVLCMFL